MKESVPVIVDMLVSVGILLAVRVFLRAPILGVEVWVLVGLKGLPPEVVTVQALVGVPRLVAVLVVVWLLTRVFVGMVRKCYCSCWGLLPR